jgi:hypothetical protein
MNTKVFLERTPYYIKTHILDAVAKRYKLTRVEAYRKITAYDAGNLLDYLGPPHKKQVAKLMLFESLLDELVDLMADADYRRETALLLLTGDETGFGTLLERFGKRLDKLAELSEPPDGVFDELVMKRLNGVARKLGGIMTQKNYRKEEEERAWDKLGDCFYDRQYKKLVFC